MEFQSYILRRVFENGSIKTFTVIQLNGFSHFQIPSPCWYANQINLKVLDIVFNTLMFRMSVSAPLCPWEMSRDALSPLGSCLFCESVPRPLGRSIYRTEPCQADLSTHSKPSAHRPSSAHLDRARRQGLECGLLSSSPSIPSSLLTDPWHLAKSMLFRYRLSPETGSHRAQPEGLLVKKKTMKRRGWK